MSGEESRDLRDRDDKANLLNMQTRADISKGNMYSHIGKNINDMAENSASLNAMNDAYSNFQYKGGKLKGKPGEVIARKQDIKNFDFKAAGIDTSDMNEEQMEKAMIAYKLANFK